MATSSIHLVFVGVYLMILCTNSGVSGDVPDGVVYTDLHKMVHKGDSVALTCRFRGTPLAVYWKKGDDPRTAPNLVSWIPIDDVTGLCEGERPCQIMEMNENYSLVIKEVSIAEQGRYICRVSTMGTLIHNFTDISVFSPPMEPFPIINECQVVSPINTGSPCTISTSHSVEISCTASGYYPDIDLYFLHGSTRLHTKDTIQVTNLDGTRNKTISAIATTSEISYVCFVSNIPGLQEMRATTVLVNLPETPFHMPTGTTIPLDKTVGSETQVGVSGDVPDDVVYTDLHKTVYEGDSVVLTCRFRGEPLAVWWKKGDDPETAPNVVSWIPTDDVTGLCEGVRPCQIMEMNEDRSLVIKRVSIAEQGRYICSVTVKGILMHNFTDISVFLTDGEVPDGVVYTDRHKTVQKDDEVVLICQFYGTPIAVYWKKGDYTTTSPNLITWVEGESPSGSCIHDGTCAMGDDFSLTIKKAKIRDRGRYICRVSKYRRSLIHNFTDLVIFAPPNEPYPVINECQEMALVNPNDFCNITSHIPIEITCSVTNYFPDIDLFFLRGFQNVAPSRTNELVNDDGTKNKSIVIEADGGEWTFVCLASDIPGTLENRTAKIVVINVKDDIVTRSHSTVSSEKEKDTRIVEIEPTPCTCVPTGLSYGASAGIAVLAILLVASVIINIIQFIMLRRHETRPGCEESQKTASREESHVSHEANENTAYEMIQNGDRAYTSLKVGPSHSPIIAPENVTFFTRLGSIGRGDFGGVWKGELLSNQSQVDVAIRQIPDQVTKSTNISRAVKVLSELPDQPNVVKCLGYCQEQGSILYEFISGGTLLTHLQTTGVQSQPTYGNLKPKRVRIDEGSLLNLAWQIAKGMQYLASKKIIHGTLCAHNVLLADRKQCKLSDYGLSSSLFSDRGKPTRWSSPETMVTGDQSTEGDSWSFGIVLWEIVTLGARPYPKMTFDTIQTEVANGYQMPRPRHCGQEVYTVMSGCWEKEATNRSNFDHILKSLERILEKTHNYLSLNDLDEGLYASTLDM